MNKKNVVTVIDDNFLDEARQDKVEMVFQLLMAGTKLDQALDKVKIKRRTWDNWRKKGFFQAAEQKARAELQSIVHEELLGGFRERLQILAGMAVGVAPAGMKVNPTQMMQALDRVNNLIQGAGDTGGKSDQTFLETYAPAQLIQINHTSNHLYNGAGNTHKMGSMPTIMDDYVEMEE